MPRYILLPMLIGTVSDAVIALGVLLLCVVGGAADDKSEGGEKRISLLIAVKIDEIAGDVFSISSTS